MQEVGEFGGKQTLKNWMLSEITSEVIIGQQMLLVLHKYEVVSSHYWGNLHTPC